MIHPFEGNEPEPKAGPEPVAEPVIETGPRPCPECESTQGYSRVGNYRVQCLNCNALLKNAEVNMQLFDKE